jgi:hypothetical protein
VAHEQAAAVVVLYDAARECEPEPPAAALGREPGLERAVLLCRRHAAAGVGDLDLDALGFLAAVQVDLDPPGRLLDRRHGVGEDVLERPLDQPRSSCSTAT